MKVLFYSSYHATPHIETELEIAQRLMNEGHEVFFLQCREELGMCFANPQHTRIGCKLCISKISRSYQRLNIPRERILSFPSVDVDYEKVYSKDAIKDVAALKQLTYKGFDIGMAVASSLISFIRDHNPDLARYAGFVDRGLKTSAFVYESANKLLDELKPDEVYLFNGRFLEVRPVMRLCEAKSIKFYTHERGGVLSKYMLREGSIPHSLEKAAAEIQELWGSGGAEKEQIGRKFFEDRKNRVIQGWHTFTGNQTWNKLPADFNPDKMNVVIFNSSMDEYEGIAGFGSRVYKDDNSGMEQILSSFQHDPSKHFYLRVHPNLKGLKNTQLKQIDQIAANYKNLTVIPAEEDIDTYGLMEHADKVLAFGSTMGIESVYWNKPVLLLGRAFYERLNCLYIPATHEEVVEMINKTDLLPFNQSEALKYGYWLLNFGNPYKHYKPTSVTKGIFDEKRITPNLFWRVFYVMQNKLKHERS